MHVKQNNSMLKVYFIIPVMFTVFSDSCE